MTRPRTALIIGGGIAGPATAVALQQVGLEASVHEARPAGYEDEGAFLTLASNGIHAARVMGLDAPLLDAGFPTPTIVLRNHRGKRLGRSLLGTSDPAGTVSHTLRRADVHRALHDQAAARGVPVSYGRRVVAVEDSADRVRARFDDGSEEVADVLVGCDGVWSTVRRAIDPGAPAPDYSGLVGTGGFARGVGLAASPGTYEMTFGRRAFLGYVVAPDGEVWWFANLPETDEPSREALRAVDEVSLRRRLHESFADDSGPASQLVDATERLVPLSPMHAVAHLPRWHGARTVVVGDAAHAPTPSSGQGASLALEDAVVLARCLRDAPTPADAFATFEQERRPRVERIIKAAARTNSSKAAGPVGRLVRDAVLPTVLRLAERSAANREVFDHRVHLDEPTAAAR